MSALVKNTGMNITALNQGSHFADLNGVKLHYRVKGNGSLLFVVSPGWGIGSLYLQRGLDFLTGRFRVVFVDTCGSGLSGRPSDAAMMGSNQMADDLDALRSHLGLSTIVLLGHSNGGAIALSFAQRYAEHVSKLILIDSQLFGFAVAEFRRARVMYRVAHHDRYCFNSPRYWSRMLSLIRGKDVVSALPIRATRLSA